MKSLLDLTIYEKVLEVPTIGCCDTDVNKYVNTLRQLDDLVRGGLVNAYMTEEGYIALWSEEIYSQDRVRDYFGRVNASEYPLKEILKIVNNVISRVSIFEDHFELHDVMVDEKVEMDPDASAFALDGDHESKFAKCVLMISILRGCFTKPTLEHGLLVRHAPSSMITIDAKIADIDCSKLEITNCLCSRDVFRGSVPVYESLSDAALVFDPSVILVEAVNEKEVELAIRIALLIARNEQSEEIKWDDIVIPKIGTAFHETCRRIILERGLDVPPKIIQSIVDTVDYKNLRKTHALRIGKGGNSPQRKRGDDTAWRRDIDKELHLHYWKQPGGLIELDSVVYHNDFKMHGS